METPTKDELLAEFRANFDSFEYPQPLVAEVIGANPADLNTWRSRGFVSIGVDKGTRVTFTGRGLIHAGIVNELAHYFDPKRAAHFSQELYNLVDAFRDNMSLRDVISFHRPYNDDGTPAEASRELYMISGAADGEGGPAQQTTLAFPLGLLMAKWAIHARLALHLRARYAKA